MPGIRILTDLEGKAALKAVSRVAKRLSFSVYRVEDWELVVQKGSLVASVFLGAFIAYCDFRVCITSARNDRVEIEIQRNSPWWTGFIGVNRVKSWAKSLADAIEDEVEDLGSRLYGRKDY